MEMYRVVCGFGPPVIRKTEVEILSDKYVQTENGKQSIQTIYKFFTPSLGKAKMFAVDFHVQKCNKLEKQIAWHTEQIKLAFSWEEI